MYEIFRTPSILVSHFDLTNKVKATYHTVWLERYDYRSIIRMYIFFYGIGKQNYVQVKIIYNLQAKGQPEKGAPENIHVCFEAVVVFLDIFYTQSQVKGE